MLHSHRFPDKDFTFFAFLFGWNWPFSNARHDRKLNRVEGKNVTNKQPNRMILKLLGMLIAISLGPAAAAETVRFHVAFEDVPGSAQLEAGKLTNGIAILEAAYAEGNVDEGEALATLCGAYLLLRDLVKARSLCSTAAGRYPNQSSLNNYGIYLAVVGDFDAAIAY